MSWWWSRFTTNLEAAYCKFLKWSCRTFTSQSWVGFCCKQNTFCWPFWVANPAPRIQPFTPTCLTFTGLSGWRSFSRRTLHLATVRFSGCRISQTATCKFRTCRTCWSTPDCRLSHFGGCRCIRWFCFTSLGGCWNLCDYTWRTRLRSSSCFFFGLWTIRIFLVTVTAVCLRKIFGECRNWIIYEHFARAIDLRLRCKMRKHGIGFRNDFAWYGRHFATPRAPHFLLASLRCEPQAVI